MTTGRCRLYLLFAVTATTIAILTIAHALEVMSVRLVSVASDGTPSNADVTNTAISANGRYVVFASAADNLVSGDNNGVADVFRHDTQTGETVLVSAAAGGGFGDGPSGMGIANVASADGERILFQSEAENLVSGDDNRQRDLFLRDVPAGTTELIDVASDGAASVKQGDPGRWLAGYQMSGDGRYIVFASTAANLVPDDTNGVIDVFIRDRQAGETRRVSVSVDGEQISSDAITPGITENGDEVVFASEAPELTSDDTNDRSDVFVKDMTTGIVERISDAPDGSQQSGDGLDPDGDRRYLFPGVSSDGRWVAFSSDADNLVASDANGVADLFLHDRVTGTTVRVSENDDGKGGNAASGGARISADGTALVYFSDAENIVPPTEPGDSVLGQLFLYERHSGATIRVSGDTGAGQANPGDPGIDANGLSVVFASAAENLVEGAPPSQGNAFLVSLTSGTDADGDGVDNAIDNCIEDANPGQEDQDADGIGDACDADIDGDELPNDWEQDNGLDATDPADAELDPDNDSLTNRQEFSVGTDPNVADTDSDSVSDGTDNCPLRANGDQTDTDGDSAGDACDADDDNDGVDDTEDAFPLDSSRSEPASDDDDTLSSGGGGGGVLSGAFIVLLLSARAMRQALQVNAIADACHGASTLES